MNKILKKLLDEVIKIEEIDESELEFVDKDDERNYKLNKILNG